MSDERRGNSPPLAGASAILVGGSKGIGWETAVRFARQGASVLLIARDGEELARKAEELNGLKASGDQCVETLVCDATDADRLQPLLADYVGRRGTPDYLINLVGYAYPQYVERLTLDDFQAAMETNYFGQLVPTLIMLPHFTAAGRGHIAFVSSVLGYMGAMGYTAYTPTKHALVGLSEALRNELKPKGIRISVLFPPDTDTPGFEIENQSKPPETAMMSANIKLMSAGAVAEEFVDGLLKGKYFIMPGEAGMVWRVNRLFPWLVRWMADREYRLARVKLGKE
jgi:3-dehydrosphinganine reductase